MISLTCTLAPPKRQGPHLSLPTLKSNFSFYLKRFYVILKPPTTVGQQPIILRTMQFDALKKLGFDDKEALVYTQLLKSGPARAAVIAYQCTLPRTTTQNILLRLEEKNVVTKAQEGSNFVYTAAHPENLLFLVEIQKRESMRKYNDLLEELTKITPDLLKLTQGYQHIPRVHFYRGKEAVRRVLFDTLSSKTELKDYANIDAMFKHVREINDEYVAEREKTDITKRSLLLDTPFARQIYEKGDYSSKSHKGYKWINSELYPFTLEMNIYDGKVSYITYVEHNFVGVIIENDQIYEMHNSMWNLIWDVLPSPGKDSNQAKK